MIEEFENLLDCREHFLRNIEVLKEAFVKYYGEKKREEIEAKFSKAIFVAYRSPETASSLIRNISDIISNEIIEKNLEGIDISLCKEDLFDIAKFDYKNLMPLSNYHNFYEMYKIGQAGRIEQFKEEAIQDLTKYIPNFTREEYEEVIRTQKIPSKYDHVRPWIRNNIEFYADLSNAEKRYQKAFDRAKNLLHKVDPDITIDNFSYYMDNKDIQGLIELSDKFPKMIEEYHSRMQKYEKYQQEDQRERDIKEQLHNKYYIRLIDENIDLLSEEDRRTFEIYRSNPKEKYQLSSYITFLFGYQLSSNQILDAFSEEADNILSNEKESKWKKDTICKNRIDYFKRNGLDLGEDYEAYENSEEAKTLRPSKERVEKFLESRNRLLNEFNNEFYTSIPSHKKIREELDSHHLLDKEDFFTAAIYTLPYDTFVNPNIVKTEDGYDLLSLLAVRCDTSSGIIDHNIIHELNHLFELTLSKVDGNNYEVICGWEVLKGEINQENRKEVDTLNEDKTKRSYELFSEIINELIAQDIYKTLLDEGVHIFDTEETARIKGATSYEYTFFLVKDFYQEFKEEIIKSRSNGNIEVIWDAVGKENFDALNELFHVFYEHFEGFKIYNVLQSLKQGEDTPQTRIYIELARRSEEIMDKMRKHNMLQQEKNKKGKTQKKNSSK